MSSQVSQVNELIMVTCTAVSTTAAVFSTPNLAGTIILICSRCCHVHWFTQAVLSETSPNPCLLSKSFRYLILHLLLLYPHFGRTCALCVHLPWRSADHLSPACTSAWNTHYRDLTRARCSPEHLLEDFSRSTSMFLKETCSVTNPSRMTIQLQIHYCLLAWLIEDPWITSWPQQLKCFGHYIPTASYLWRGPEECCLNRDMICEVFQAFWFLPTHVLQVPLHSCRFLQHTTPLT